MCNLYGGMGACPHDKIISSDHRFLKKGVRGVVACAKKSLHGVPWSLRRVRRSGGLGDEIPHFFLLFCRRDADMVVSPVYIVDFAGDS